MRVSGGRNLPSDGTRGGVTMTVDNRGAIRARFEKVLVPQSGCTEFLTCLLVCSGGIAVLIAAAGLVIPLCSMRVRGEFRFEYKS